MKISTILYSLVLAVYCLLSPVGCNSNNIEPRDSSAAPSAIKVGVVLPMTGEYAEFGNRMFAGLMYACDEINAQGGVNGAKIDLDVRDNKSTALLSVRNFQSLGESDAVAIIGPYSSINVMAVKTMVAKFKIPTIIPTATYDEITQRNKYMFQASFTDSLQAEVLAKYVKNKMNINNVVVLIDVDEDGVYSRTLGRLFVRFYQLSGGMVSQQVQFRSNDNLSSAVAKAVAANPEAIFAPGYASDVVEIIRRARNLGYKGIIFGADACDSQTLLELGKDTENVFFSSMFSSENTSNPMVKYFVNAMKNRTGKTPESFEAKGYDSLYYLIGAMTGPHPTRQTIQEQLLKVETFNGVCGAMTYNQSQSVIGCDVYIKTIKMDDKGNYRFHLETVVR